MIFKNHWDILFFYIIYNIYCIYIELENLL